eukprot:598585-Rhodomonas_salina.1
MLSKSITTSPCTSSYELAASETIRSLDSSSVLAAEATTIDPVAEDVDAALDRGLGGLGLRHSTGSLARVGAERSRSSSRWPGVEARKKAP